MSSARIKWFKIPPRIWILAFALLCVVLPELAIFEWSAILTRAAGIDLALRAVPFGAFMMGMIIGAVSNIILDAVFIVLLDMGIKGAALATVIAQVISVLSLACNVALHRRLPRQFSGH